MTNSIKSDTIVNKLCKGCEIVTQKEFVENYIRELEKFYKHYVKTEIKYKAKYNKITRQQSQKDASDAQIIDAIFEYDSDSLARIVRYNDMEDSFYDATNHRSVFATVLLGMQYEEGSDKRKSLLNEDIARIRAKLVSNMKYIKEVLEFRQVGLIEDTARQDDFHSRVRVPQNQLNRNTKGYIKHENGTKKEDYGVAK